MTSLDLDGQNDGISTMSDSPPTHFSIKIESFSLLAKNSVQAYESGSFEAGGYKWKIVIYPNGNKSRKVTEHISVYLALAESGSVCAASEVYAVFRLFLLDQNSDNYLIVEDASKKERRFHRLKKQWGFDQFILLKVFNDVSNGFLVDDTCVFGAEVFVRKERKRDKGECLSMITDPINYKHVWKIENFSKLDAEPYDSKEFHAGSVKWKIQLYRKGRRNGTGTHLSLYLTLADFGSFSSESRIFATVTLRILDQMHAKHIAGTVTRWFSASEPEFGWARYMLLSSFTHSNRGFLVKDICTIEAEVSVLGVAGPMP